MATREIPVPDIGDFKNIPVIEIHVKPGDVVAKDAPLVTLESDKATVEVPSPQPGTIKELKVKIGDWVSKGSIILLLDAAEGAAAPASAGKSDAKPEAKGERRPREGRAPAAAAEKKPAPAGGHAPPVRPLPRPWRQGRAPRGTPTRPSTPRCWCWAPGPAATPRRFGRPTSARRWSWSSATRVSAASA